MKTIKSLLFTLLTLAALTSYGKQQKNNPLNLTRTEPIAVIFQDNYGIGVSNHYYADITVKFFTYDVVNSEFVPEYVTSLTVNYRRVYDDLVEPQFNTDDVLDILCTGFETVIRYNAPVQSDPNSGYQSWAYYYTIEEGNGYVTG